MIRVRAKQLLFYAASLVKEGIEFNIASEEEFSPSVMDKVADVPVAPVKKVTPPAPTFPAVTSLPPAAATVGSEIGVGGAQTARTPMLVTPSGQMPDLPVVPPEATVATGAQDTPPDEQPTAAPVTSSPRRRSTAAMRG